MRYLQRTMLLAVTLALAMSAAAARAGEPEPDPYTRGPLAPVTFTTASGDVTLWVEIADTAELMACGMMHRLSMPADQAMLFVMPRESSGPFWSRNTFIPLSLAWLGADGTVVDITDLANVSPEDDPQRPAYTYPAAPYYFVIEANLGWFQEHGVAAGDRAELATALATGSQGAEPICRERGL